MAKRLTNMQIDEVSIVDDPANEEARVVIVKTRGGGADMAEIAKSLQGALEALSPQIVEKALADLGTVNPDAVEAATAIMKEAVMDLEAMTKALETAEASVEELAKKAAKLEADNADLDKKAKAAEAKAKEAEDKMTKALEDVTKAKAAPEDEDAAFLKSLPEGARERILKDRAELAEGRAAIEKAKAEKEEAEYIEKAKDLGGDAKVLGPVLMRIAKGKTTEADATAIEALLKSMAAIAAKSPLFKNIGTGAGDPNAGDPEAMLKAKAEAIQKANEGMTYAVAYTKALEENPDLYAEYTKTRTTTRA
jgi:hypothetical protein